VLTPDGNKAGSRNPELFHARGPTQAVFLPGEPGFPLPWEAGCCSCARPGRFQGQGCRFTPCSQLCPTITTSKPRLRESAESGGVLSRCRSLPVTRPFLNGNVDFPGSTQNCFSTTCSREMPALGGCFWGSARQSLGEEGQQEGDWMQEGPQQDRCILEINFQSQAQFLVPLRAPSREGNRGVGHSQAGMLPDVHLVPHSPGPFCTFPPSHLHLT